MIKVAGWLITLCGIGHTVGAVAQTAQLYVPGWLSWDLWTTANSNLTEMTHTAAAFWFTWYSFGPMLLLVGLIVIWLGHRVIVPPRFVAWALMAWTVVGSVLSGLSPLLLLLPAGCLLLVAARRAGRPARDRVRPTLARAAHLH